MSASASADAQTSAKELNPAERWVVEQVIAGKLADLTVKFPEEKDRKLRARFLEDLLTKMLPGVEPHRKGVRIHGAIIDEPLELANAQIPYEVWLDKCRFTNDAIFVRASFAGAVSFDYSTFEAAANFNGMKVDGSAFFRKAIFEGKVNFVNAYFASYFTADEAKFKNKVQPSTFSGMKVGTASFFKAVFEGPVDFGNVEIAGNFTAREAQFQNTEQEVDFQSMKVGGTGIFQYTVFEGPVNFAWAHFARNFRLEKVQFKNKEQKANFNGMNVGHNAFFHKAVFEAPVNFAKVEISSQLNAQEAEFRNEKQGASFNAIKIGDAFFENAVFKAPVDFRYADFDWISLSSVSWPKDGHWMDMTAMTYKYIRADAPGFQPHDAVLKLIDQSTFSADVYKNLEAFFLRQGYRAHADETFIAGKRRERKEHLSGLPFFGSLVLDLLVGYGRRAWQIAIPCAILVGFGFVLFSPNKMEPQKIDTTPRIYNRFWYSLGLFLPIVNLESDKVWKPKPEQTFLRNYMRVHILLGWILIPILVAALTGLIK